MGTEKHCHLLNSAVTKSVVEDKAVFLESKCEELGKCRREQDVPCSEEPEQQVGTY